MFRFQIYTLSVIILLGGAASLVGESQALLHERERFSETQLVAARAAAESAIGEWAASNVNRVVELASGDAVRAPLQELRQAAAADRAKLVAAQAERLLAPLVAWREGVPGAERPDWILVVDAEGRVLLRTNAPADRGDSIAGIPLVATMLRGAALDGVWVLDDGPHAVAAAATLGAGAVVGGVIAGYKLEAPRIAGIATRLPELAGTSIGLALMWAGKPLGQSFVIEQGTVIPASDEPTPYGASSLPYAPLPLLAPELGQYIGTALPTRGWPSQLLLAVNVPHADTYADVAERQLLILAATVLLFLVSLAWGLSIRSAVTKPLGRMVDHLSAVQQGGSVGVIPDVILRDPYTRLGKLINMLITRGGVASRPVGARDDLSAVLGGGPEPVPQRTGDFQFEGLNSLGSPSAPGAAPAVASLPADALSPVDDAQASGIASLFDDGEPEPAVPPPPRAARPASAPALAPTPPRPAADDDEGESAADFLASLSAGQASVPPPRPATPPPPAAHPFAPPQRPTPPAAPPPQPAPAAAAAGWNPERTVMVQVPEELLAASASTAAPVPAAPRAEDYNPDSTVVAAIPDDLLKAATSGPAVDPDDAHFHEVYDQFIATRKECGESISDLSYDRFLIKLHKNREQLISKYGCRTVRFQVYVKAGKAALKAVPVRD